MLAAMDALIDTTRSTSRSRGARAERDYERIARAIHYLRCHASLQPDLDAAARHVNLSEYHFQRLFTRWVGVSPKRFLQYLTVEQAKARLVRSGSMADVVAEVGLSGAGRLHDLFATLEGISPGEFRRAGSGLTIRYGIHESPFGDCLIATTERGVCGLHFIDRNRDEVAALRADWPAAKVICDAGSTGKVAARLFDPIRVRTREPLSLLVKGTNFQLQVWRALLAIPPGHLTTYSELGQRVGHPGAARAVGNAVAANRIAWLIPCHRVIRETGEFGNYRWGESRKAAMLGWEAAQRDRTDGTARPELTHCRVEA
jgi:AraC family transcriptional regulator of adaptative response/methylated-DNA-[protein]-cysteine methyltransferase